MRKQRWIAIPLILMGMWAKVGYAEPMRFVVDPDHASITFKVKHMMLATVTGTFNHVEGWIDVDPNDLTTAKAEGVIDVMSIDTRNKKRDDHLKSDDFFAAEKHPTIKMVLKRVFKKDGQWWAEADLTIRGITKPVQFPFTFTGPVKDPMGNDRIAVEGSFTIDRFDYGLKWNKVLETGALVVDRTVRVEFQIEGVHKPQK